VYDVPGYANMKYEQFFCDGYCPGMSIILNNTPEFKDIRSGKVHCYFINEQIIRDYEPANIFNDLSMSDDHINFLHVVTHELGHILGLDHFDQLPCPPSVYSSSNIMNSQIVNNLNFSGLSIDDICMFKKLYCPELTPVEEEHQISTDIKNYPNPLEEFAYIELSIPNGGDIVSIKIYSIFNELVNVIDKNYMSSGTHKFKFDASSLPPGVYFCEINIGRSKFVKKMVAYR
jgi:hypothetical protein